MNVNYSSIKLMKNSIIIAGLKLGHARVKGIMWLFFLNHKAYNQNGPLKVKFTNNYPKAKMSESHSQPLAISIFLTIYFYIYMCIDIYYSIITLLKYTCIFFSWHIQSGVY